MSLLVPAILPTSRKDLEDKLARLAGLTTISSIQIDTIDGKFAYPACWPYTTPDIYAQMLRSGETLPGFGTYTIDADLMVLSPERAAEEWSALGASRLTLHAESAPDIDKAVAHVRARHGHDKDFMPGLLEIGLALNVGTKIEPLVGVIEQVDYVEVMGIAHIGKQGEPFEHERAVAHVKELRKRFPALVIQVDGGVSLQTAPELLAAGADRLIVGSAFWNSRDLVATVRAFEDLGRQYGVYERVIG